jgi:hypothetical protein
MRAVINFCITWFLRISGVAGVVVCISYYVAPSTRDAFHHPIENLLWGIFFILFSGAPALNKKKKD